MSDQPTYLDAKVLAQWRAKIATANQYNIFCHCRLCQAQWVESSEEGACQQCGAKDIERISCWQFPDD